MTRYRTYHPEVADLILLNGPPASGKSTMAQRYVDAHPPALNLDIDVLRRLLGGWAEDPEASGLVARRFALAIAEQQSSSAGRRPLGSTWSEARSMPPSDGSARP